MDIAVYYPANGTWYIQKSTGGNTIQNWGWIAALPVLPQYQINRSFGFVP